MNTGGWPRVKNTRLGGLMSIRAAAKKSACFHTKPALADLEHVPADGSDWKTTEPREMTPAAPACGAAHCCNPNRGV